MSTFPKENFTASIDHVMFMTSLSRPQVYILVRADFLPRRVPRSAKRGVWRQEEICQWMQRCLDHNRVHPHSPNTTIIHNADRFINKKQLLELVDLSAPTILQMERAGGFPSRVKLSDARVAWLLREIEFWLDNRPRMT